MTDLALALSDDGTEINLKLTPEGSLLMEGGLETAVLLSLFTDARVAESELPPGLNSVRGWWGDEFLSNPGDKTGSKLWTFSRDKLNTKTAASIQVRAKQALAWMIDDGTALKVDVTTAVKPGFIEIIVKITRPSGREDRFAMQWDGQSIKR